mgnify:CR=1 FL=1
MAFFTTQTLALSNIIYKKDFIMNKHLTAAIVGTLLTTSALASQESNHYQSYFEPTSVQHLLSETKLYNEENGYWEHAQIMNVELVRHLTAIEKEQQQAVAIQNEEYGYWQ